MSYTQCFDVVVLGAGPAGKAAAVTATLLGKRVAIIEKLPVVGGAAVNTGTVPSKTLRETALALSGLRARDLYGVDLSLRRSATVDDLLRHERTVTSSEREQYRQLLDRYGVTIVHGTGRFLDPHTVGVVHADGSETQFRAETIVIAIGSVPIRPPGLPFEHPRVHDSDELVDLHVLPRSLAIVGAGVIGSEYACMFTVLGVPTYLIDSRDVLLPFLDAELSAALHAAMIDLGVRFVWGETVANYDAPAQGDVILTLASGRTLTADHVLICAGRASCTEELNLTAAGLAPTDKGRLAVNAHYQTAVPHIYAIGDVIGFPALASTSAEQGRVAACHICGSTIKTELAPILPTGIYTIPEVSSAGETETALREQGIDYVVGRAEYAQTPRGKIIGERTGFLKLLFRRSDLKLLGVHVIGEQAAELVHIGLLALMSEAGGELFLRTCFNYPTLGELYKLATHDALLRRAKGG
jgi:NAD(P) transhydrogenase